jgi:hypothetical protein
MADAPASQVGRVTTRVVSAVAIPLYAVPEAVLWAALTLAGCDSRAAGFLATHGKAGRGATGIPGRAGRERPARFSLPRAATGTGATLPTNGRSSKNEKSVRGFLPASARLRSLHESGVWVCPVSGGLVLALDLK